MTENRYDATILGGGSGGYVCAIRAAQLGLKTALVEKEPHLGGTCLNVGCIPSKALLHSTEMFRFTARESKIHGIETGPVGLDLAALMKRKDTVVDTLRKGVETLVAKRNIALFHGRGTLSGKRTIKVEGKEGVETIASDHIVIATGSKVAELPFLEIDGEVVVSSDHALAFEKVPGKLLVVGGGAIGLELGSVWSRLGSAVTIVEFLPRIAPGFDEDISKLAERIFKRQGLAIETSAKVSGLQKKKGAAVVTIEKNNRVLEKEADKVLLAVGRVPFTEGLGLEELGVAFGKGGFIATDGKGRTNVEGIFAIGDVVEGPMLAHKAEEEGIAAAETIAGRAGAVNYEAIPNVIYTDPEIAGVGISEAEAKKRNIKVKIGTFPLRANGRALASDATLGMVKVMAAADTDRLLGVQMLSRNASEIIAAAVTHIEYGGSAEDIARTIHAHPTLSEALKEAALAVEGASLHSL